MATKTPTGAKPKIVERLKTSTKLEHISPKDIRKNPENPRKHFKESQLDELAESIDENGVLVPVVVYRDPEDDKKYRLVDGERRWRCAVRLGLETVPAIVVDKPNPKDNILSMFNIHMVREEWDDIPTTDALKKVIDRTGEKDPDKLAQMTGVSPEQVRRYLLAMELPDRYQKYVDDNKIPLNFFVELDRNVIRPLAEHRPALFKRYGVEKIREAFVKKKLDNVIRDVILLRQVRPIINIAAKEAGGPEGTSDLDDVITDLIDKPDQTIEDSYEESVGIVVEADKFARQCDLLVLRLDRLEQKVQSTADRKLLVDATQSLVKRLNKRLTELRSARSSARRS